MAINEFGLDARYFHERLARTLRDIERFHPDELARELVRTALTANPEVLSEQEFGGPLPLAGNQLCDLCSADGVCGKKMAICAATRSERYAPGK